MFMGAHPRGSAIPERGRRVVLPRARDREVGMKRSRWIVMAVTAALIATVLGVGVTTSSASTTFTNRIVQNPTTLKYHYKPITMTVHKGDSVVWKNKTNAPHTVTFNNGSYSKSVPVGGSVKRTFKKRGTFKYHCNIHTYMHGTITVT
jgi:plastocyanin